MQFNEEGYLRIKAETASGALPAPFISVTVRSTDENNLGIAYSITTDRDGIAEPLTLPAPPGSLSQSPNPPETVFAKYSVEAYGEGFYQKRVLDVEVFSGVTTLLSLEMVPKGDYEKAPRPPSNSVIISENEEL